MKNKKRSSISIQNFNFELSLRIKVLMVEASKSFFCILAIPN